jgi:hypothetical protein
MTRCVRRWVAAAVAVAATGLMVGLAATTGVNQCWSRGFSKPIRTLDVSGPGSVRVTS